MAAARIPGLTPNPLLLAAAAVVAVIWVAPIVWVIGLSFKPNDVLMFDTGNILSPPFTLENYANILAASNVFRWIGNSLIVATGTTLLVLAVSSLAGYAFARLEFPGRRVLFVLVLAGLAVPDQAIFIPL